MPDWEMFFWVFVKMWSIKVEVVLIALVGQSINWLRRYIEQNSLYLFISGNKFLSSFLISFDLLRIYLSWKSKFVLKSRRTYISLSSLSASDSVIICCKSWLWLMGLYIIPADIGFFWKQKINENVFYIVSNTSFPVKTNVISNITSYPSTFLFLSFRTML